MPFAIDATGARYVYEKGDNLPHYKGMGSSKKRTYANRAGNVTKAVKLCMQRLAEHKHVSTSLALTPVPAGGSVISAVILSQGTSATSRTGNQIHIDNIQVELQYNLAAATTGDIVRTLIVWDHEANGANPAVADILESAAIVAPYNRDKVKPRGRFTILFDRVKPCNVMTQAVGVAQYSMRFKKKVDTTVYYQSNAGTISDVLKNNLVVIQLSGSGVVTSGGNVQICYTDL